MLVTAKGKVLIRIMSLFKKLAYIGFGLTIAIIALFNSHDFLATNKPIYMRFYLSKSLIVKALIFLVTVERPFNC